MIGRRYTAWALCFAILMVCFAAEARADKEVKVDVKAAAVKVEVQAKVPIPADPATEPCSPPCDAGPYCHIHVCPCCRGIIVHHMHWLPWKRNPCRPHTHTKLRLIRDHHRQHGPMCKCCK